MSDVRANKLRLGFLRVAQFINRHTTCLHRVKDRLRLGRIAEGLLVRKLTHQEIQAIRSSLCADFVSRKIQMLREDGVEKINFYVFLTQSIGDIIANEPIPRHLKSLVPTASVHWIVNRNFTSLLAGNPNIDEVIPVDGLVDGEDLCMRVAKVSGNIVVDCHFDGIVFDPNRKPHDNPANRAVNVYTHYYFGPLLSTFSLAAGLPPLNDQPIFHLRHGVVRPEFGVADYVVFHCRSNEEARDWGDSKWNRLAGLLAQNGVNIVEIGTRRIISKSYNGMVIDYTGRKDLQVLATIVRDARLFVGIDSAFAHVANCFNTPSIVILGKYKVFDAYLPYSGSFPQSKDFTIIRAPSGCPASKVMVDEVLSAVLRKLNKPRKSDERLAR